MEAVELEIGESDFSASDRELWGNYFLLNCPRCCHWIFEGREGTNRCMDGSTICDASSIARKFDSPVPEGCAAEIAQQLRQNPSFWHTMAPRDMERFVADVFRANYQQAEVMHVGKPGDLGVDVLFIDAGGEDWLIQVKRREAPNAVEGFETLQRLLGTLLLEGKLRGIIATTADRFSRNLVTQKNRLERERQGYRIELLDRGKLDRMLSPLLPNRPWLDLLKSDLFDGIDSEVRRHFVQQTSNAKQPSLF